MPEKVLLQLYYSLILPYLTYSISVWGFQSESIFKLQKRAIRIITNKKYNAHTDPIFKNLGILKLSDLFAISHLKLFFRYQQNELPGYFSNMFESIPREHNYQLRTQNKHFNQPNKVSSKKCIRYHLPKLIQSLPNCITGKVHTHSYQSFINYAKQHILKNYPTECQIQNCYICTN